MYKSRFKPIPGKPLTTTIPALLEWRGISPRGVEEATDGKVFQSNIQRICSGKTKNPGQDVVGGIAEFFGLSISEIYSAEFVQAFIKAGGSRKRMGQGAIAAAYTGERAQPGILKDAQVQWTDEQAKSIFANLTADAATQLIEEFVQGLPKEDRIKIAQACLADLD
ncbi:MAG: hypothetical protein CME59_02345 [Halioglobus sp.]|nr:hypothetical protein [Halioglobus sp.]